MPTPVVRALNSPFQVREIATSIREAVTVPDNASPALAYQTLSGHGFDQAPVTKSGRIVGWVRTAALPGAAKIRGVATQLDQCALVSETAPLSVGLEAMGKRGFIFTVGDLGVTGFVTTSDLDKHPVRSHFYLLLAATEMLLAQIVGLTTPDEQIMTRIAEDRGAAERWRVAVDEGIDLNAVEYLNLRDLAELFAASPVADDHSAWTAGMGSDLTRLCHLRTRVMHPTRPLLGRSSPAELASSARAAEGVIEALQALASDL